MNDDDRKILSPFNAREAMTVQEAVGRSGKSERCIRNWCEVYGIGRKIGCEWHVSRVALEMFLESDYAALELYHAGAGDCETVQRYFQSLGISRQIRQIGQTGTFNRMSA